MNKNINISNTLSLFRLIVAPVIMFLIIFDKMDFALVLFVIAALTDLFDGYIARKLKEETRLGEILDRVSDKLLIGFPFIAVLIRYNLINWIFVFGIVVILYIMGGVLFFKRKHKPILLGRAIISLQTITLVFLIMDFDYKWVLLWFTIILMIIVSLFYVYRILKERIYKK